jgi:diguanylate cyclase (GGDEF)-like protein
VLGVAAASVLAGSTYAAANTRAATSFRDSAASISSALTTTIRRDDDFVVSQEGMFEAFPGLTNAQYRTALQASDIAERYPGGLGFSFIERVPGAELRNFAGNLAKDPPRGVPVPAPARYVPFPPGSRAQYCLTRDGVQTGRVAQQDMIATFDFCADLGPASPFPVALGTATDSAELSVTPPIVGYAGVFFVAAPVYKDGVVPAGTAARRADVIGWVLGTFSGPGTLQSVLGNVRGFGIRLAYMPSHRAPLALASAGSRRGGGIYSVTAAAGTNGQWSITVVGGLASGALGQALVVGFLVLGIALLLFLGVRLLARSRQRALTLVDERTKELRHQALHDALTGLPNRALIVDRVGQMLARTHREPLAFGVLFIDLDNFKEINDSFGHHHGDDLLRAVGERLAAIVRPSDSVGRLGGDEFVVLVQGNSLDAGPDIVAQRVLEVLSEPFRLSTMPDVPLSVHASIGVAVGARPDADELLRDADVALYQAKQAGKGRYVIFRPEMQVAVQERLALEMDLREAVAGGQLFVLYQPTFDLASLAMTGVEALVRWRHPRRGVIGPDRFISIAEDSGMIIPLGRFVLSESCRQAAAWSSSGRVVQLSVNVSGRQLERDDFPADVAGALADSGLDPTLLTLELTESVLMRDADATIQRLQALRDLGVKLAIDDFGTGYSSLAYLRRFPLDVLKIDRSFIGAMARSPEARSLIHTLVQLGKTLGLETLAEGIEDATQLEELQRQHCEYGQGFYYSRPVSASAVEALFAPAHIPPHVAAKT